MSARPLIPFRSLVVPRSRSVRPLLPLPPAVGGHLYGPAPPVYYPWFSAAAPPPSLVPARFLFGPRFPRMETDREPPQKRRKSSEEKARRFTRQRSREGTKHVAHEGQRPEEDAEAEGTIPRMTESGPEQLLQRQWEPVRCSYQPPPPGVSAGFDFTVMSYNILSQDLLLDNAHLYRHCPPELLAWDYRLPRLLQEIRHHDADILCLQEVQQNHFEAQIRPSLEALGYRCEYKKRTGRKSDGCAVAFKTSRLSLLSSNHVEFFRRGDALLNRDNVGLVVRLSPASDPASRLCVANAHLLFNPRRGDVKLAQLAVLLAELDRASRLPDGSANPVLLCGDFNSTPFSPLYRFLTTGRLDYKGLSIGMVSGQEPFSRAQRLLCCPLWSNTLGINNSCQYRDQEQYQDRDRDRDQDQDQSSRAEEEPPVEGAISELTVDDASRRWRLSHSLKLKSSYNHRLNQDEVTTCNARTAMTVDYILYTPDSPVGPAHSSSCSLPGGRGLQLLERLSLVGRPELELVNGLPNETHASDHLPLLARFRLPRR